MSNEAMSYGEQEEPPSYGGLLFEMDTNCPLEGVSSPLSVAEKAVYAVLARALTGPECPMELYIELVDNDRSQVLNAEFRGRDYPTNVLSFPGVDPDDIPDTMRFALAGGPPFMLGDLILASKVVEVEAAAQQKTVEHHLVHLVVHGVLHLLGYDHIDDNEAEEMEQLERDILAGLGIEDPYRIIDND